MPSDNFTKKAEEIDKKINELKAQKQNILSRAKKQDRKERTRRLIEIGAIVEKGLQVDSKHKALALVEYLTKYPDKLKKLTEFVESNESILKEKDFHEKSKNPQMT
jgi:hypothetical protein